MRRRRVQYDFISTPNPNWKESKQNEIEKRDKNRIGFVAQELKEVYPELVIYDEGDDEYSIKYTGMIPVLVEAIKEQQILIEKMQSEIDNLKKIE